MIKVMIVDDHQVVRNSLKHQLSYEAEIDVVAEANSGRAALDKLTEGAIKPDIILLDLNLPDINGLDVLKQLTEDTVAKHSRIIVCTAHASYKVSMECFSSGASGFVSKDTPFPELRKAVSQVYHSKPNTRYVCNSIAKQITASLLKNSKSKKGLVHLANREREVLTLLIQGLSAKQIAADLEIHEKTINTYRQRLFDKLGVPNNVGLAMQAWRLGLFARTLH